MARLPWHLPAILRAHGLDDGPLLSFYGAHPIPVLRLAAASWARRPGRDAGWLAG